MSELRPFHHRRGTASGWAASNTVLLDGQMGLETDTKKIKLGDGVTAWNSLPYWGQFLAGESLAATVVPRTGTVSSLAALTANAGELASATDSPAIVQTQASGTGEVYRPGTSVKLVTATSSATVKATSDVINVAFNGSSSVLTLTLTGMYDGQQALLVLDNAGAATGSVTINGVAISFPPEPNPKFGGAFPLLSVLVQYLSGSYFIRAVAADTPPTNSNLGITFGYGCVAKNISGISAGSSSVSVGKNAFSFGAQTYVEEATNTTYGGAFGLGTRNFVKTYNGLAVGTANILVNSTTPAFAFGNSCEVTAPNGAAFGNSCSVGELKKSIVSVSGDVVTVSGGNFTGLFTIGSQAMVMAVSTSNGDRQDGKTDRAYQSFVTNVSYDGTNTLVTVFNLNAFASTSTFNYIAALSSGDKGFAIGSSGRALQKQQFAHGMGGGRQFTRTLLRTDTSNATAKEMSLDDTGAAITGTYAGVATRLVTETGKKYALEITVFASQASSANSAMFKRMAILANVGGTVTLSTPQTIGTDITSGLSVSAPTIQVDSGNKSLQIMVTGIAATTIAWLAEIEALEITN